MQKQFNNNCSASRVLGRGLRAAICATVLVVCGTALATNAATAKEQIQADPASDTRLVLLGTNGGPVLRSDRSQPSNLLIIDGHAILIDAGDGAAAQARKAGVEVPSIEMVFLTHMHLDHTADLPSLAAHNWSHPAGKAFKVYGPTGSSRFMEDGVRSMAMPISIYATQLPSKPDFATFAEVTEIRSESSEPFLVMQNDYMRVSAVANSHFDTVARDERPEGMENTLSLRFDTDERSIVFTGDTGPSDAVVRLAKDADVLVAEVIDLASVETMLREGIKVPEAALVPTLRHMAEEHLTGEELGKMAAAANVKMLVLTHFAYGSELNRDHVLSQLRKHYLGPVVFGVDLLEL
jgi:ribonuclease BN (tRNA processing enzyme)